MYVVRLVSYLFDLCFLSLVSIQDVLAAPKVYSEVTPGLGMPSLAKLNVMSAQL